MPTRRGPFSGHERKILLRAWFRGRGWRHPPRVGRALCRPAPCGRPFRRWRGHRPEFGEHHLARGGAERDEAHRSGDEVGGEGLEGSGRRPWPGRGSGPARPFPVRPAGARQDSFCFVSALWADVNARSCPSRLGEPLGRPRQRPGQCGKRSVIRTGGHGRRQERRVRPPPIRAKSPFRASPPGWRRRSPHPRDGAFETVRPGEAAHREGGRKPLLEGQEIGVGHAASRCLQNVWQSVWQAYGKPSDMRPFRPIPGPASMLMRRIVAVVMAVVPALAPPPPWEWPRGSPRFRRPRPRAGTAPRCLPPSRRAPPACAAGHGRRGSGCAPGSMRAGVWRLPMCQASRARFPPGDGVRAVLARRGS